MEDPSEIELSRADYLRELSDTLTEPIHRRLLSVYQHAASVEAMEEELARILLEVIRDED